jgi:predicted transcriptional regulator
MMELFTPALRIGCDHISSTVNTLFLASAGAALPLLLLFNGSAQSLSSVATPVLNADTCSRSGSTGTLLLVLGRGRQLVARRPVGALEKDILRVIWAADRPLTPGQVVERLGLDLAYTSVATVIGRLYSKDLLVRTKSGRGYEYTAAVTEPELAARMIGRVLDSSADRRAAMTGFVSGLSKRDAKALRQMLDDLEQ